MAVVVEAVVDVVVWVEVSAVVAAAEDEDVDWPAAAAAEVVDVAAVVTAVDVVAVGGVAATFQNYQNY